MKHFMITAKAWIWLNQSVDESITRTDLSAKRTLLLLFALRARQAAVNATKEVHKNSCRSTGATSRGNQQRNGTESTSPVTIPHSCSLCLSIFILDFDHPSVSLGSIQRVFFTIVDPRIIPYSCPNPSQQLRE